MKVLVVTDSDPWADGRSADRSAHRQALAVRAAGAEVRVLVLAPVLPTADVLRRGRVAEILKPLAQPRPAELEGLTVDHARILAAPWRPGRGAWGARAVRPLRSALAHLRSGFAFDLVHAHGAVPAAAAVLDAGAGVPVVVSEPGGDAFSAILRSKRGESAVRRTLGAAGVVLADSTRAARRFEALGAGPTAIVRLGTELPAGTGAAAHGDGPSIVTVGPLVHRKRHADVMRALMSLRDRHPALRYRIAGDGPERDALAQLAGELGVAERVELTGPLAPETAHAAAWGATLFAMPSVDEAFGAAYVEAMAGGVPAIGSRGELGPEEIAALGTGLRLVPPGDVEALAAEIDAIVSEPAYRSELAEAARATVAAHFTWERCGAATLAAYEAALDD
jgi:teichuronic acid biosynthesis glycosyltransferase TuaC